MISPPSVVSSLIKFMALRHTVALWKKLVFESPSLSQLMRDFCLQKVSYCLRILWYSLVNLFISSALILENSILSSTSCSLAISVSNFMALLENVAYFECWRTSRYYLCQISFTSSSILSFSYQKISNVKGLGPENAFPSGSISTGLWSLVARAKCLTTTAGNSNIRSIKAKAPCQVFPIV